MPRFPLLDPTFHRSFHHQSWTVRRRISGVALVLVLAFLVLITGLVIAFFTSVTNDLVTAKTSTGELLAKQLADSTTQIVEAQIRTATSTKPDTNGSYAWASQPGMIRVYDSDGKAQGFYKLYSSNKMTLLQADATGFQMTDDLKTDWDTQAALYVDLNSPVMQPDPANPSAAAKPVFPIIDPRARSSVPKNVQANTQDGVEGFDYSDGAAMNTGTDLFTTQPMKINGVKVTKASLQGDDARLPMPARWLYVLRDGSLTIPDSASSGTTASFAQATADLQPSSTNPIVGRVAFWTDDETCKVNVNTASEGTYWDVPRVWTTDDGGAHSGNTATTPGLAVCQPAQNEFQRYPGHPATTSISSVFGFVLSSPYQAGTMSLATAAQLDPFYELIPRVLGGGSKGGTAIPQGYLDLKLDQDRLYASVDELLFKTTASAKRVANPTATAKSRSLTQADVEKARFFITANSRAPEVNLFNFPRISMWPEWRTANLRTPKDKLLAFCSTIGGKEFYFTRQNPRSSTDDYSSSQRNSTLYKYLQNLTGDGGKKIPGFTGGSTFVQKYPAASNASSLTGQPAGTTDRDQILTSIYDYIRCTNLNDSTTGATPYTKGGSEATAGFGEVVPIEIGSTRGFGREDTITQAAVDFYAFKPITPPVTGSSPIQPGATMQLKGLFLTVLSGVMQGLCPDYPNIKISVSGLDTFSIGINPPAGSTVTTTTMIPMGFPAGGTNTIDAPSTFGFHGRGVGGTEGFIMTLSASKNAAGTGSGKYLNSVPPYPGTIVPATVPPYPFCTPNSIVVPMAFINASTNKAVQATTMDFSGGKLIVQILSADTGAVVQTVNLDFPKATKLPIPTLYKTGDFNPDRLDNNQLQTDALFRNLLPTNDTTIGLELAGKDPALPGSEAPTYLPSTDGRNPSKSEPTSGDVRMIAALKNVPSTYYRAHNAYTLGVSKAHSLMTSMGVYYLGGIGGLVVKGAGTQLDYDGTGGGYGNLSYASIRNPDLPSRVGTAGVMRADNLPGDWDTGAGMYKDGAYINKPDDGDVALQDGGTDRIPYISNEWTNQSAGQTYFSPNRQVSSPMMIGSIPSGVQRRLPWQTLLFRPDAKHPGSVAPMDHLLADFFWMPVVEPYAISEPFSTAGKINMNYQLMPFGNYIRRDTGLRAVMKATKFAAIKTTDGSANYKPHYYIGANPGVIAPTRRYIIDAQATLDNGFEKRFSGATTGVPDIFHSASEISTVDLYTPNQTSMTSFWTINALTGDNLREKPYGDMYSRLTTKSNTFTVHMITQSLRQSIPDSVAATDKRWTQWSETKDQILGQYRGSSIIERYIDANDTALQGTDFAGDSTFATDTSNFYKFRVVSTKQFGQ